LPGEGDMNQPCGSCGKRTVWWNSIRKITHCHNCDKEAVEAARVLDRHIRGGKRHAKTN
jgi:hypothetical protein